MPLSNYDIRRINIRYPPREEESEYRQQELAASYAYASRAPTGVGGFKRHSKYRQQKFALNLQEQTTVRPALDDPFLSSAEAADFSRYGKNAENFRILCKRKEISRDEEAVLRKMCLGCEPRLEVLNVVGSLILDDEICVAVVGSRKITQYGRDVCEYIAGGLAAAGVTIASGLMYGVDLCAHKAAVSAGGRTIAVLGYGFDYLKTVRYARPIVDEIILKKCGAIVSEYEDAQLPNVWTFPRRNRIVAAFSKAIVIIEASENSGSIITAGLALEQGKEVFVIPGSIFSDVSRGKHKLLKQGAIPVDSPEDILNHLGISNSGSLNSRDPTDHTDSRTSLTPPLNLSENELAIWKILKSETNPLTLDDLLFETKMSLSSLSVAVTSLELFGLAKRDFSNRIFLRPP